MTGWRVPLVVVVLLVGPGALFADQAVELRTAPQQQFRLVLAPPALAAPTPLAGLDGPREEFRVRLPGDADSLFTLGGPAPSGQPRVRLAVEVNEAILKVLAPDPKVESNDLRGRPSGDWKPIDATGRPYQLRFGARLIW